MRGPCTTVTAAIAASTSSTAPTSSCSALLRGEFTISGFQARHLRAHLPDLSTAQLSRALKRLRLHGLIKKIGHRYKYYLTTLGRRVATTALKLRELVVIPALTHPVPA